MNSNEQNRFIVESPACSGSQVDIEVEEFLSREQEKVVSDSSSESDKESAEPEPAAQAPRDNESAGFQIGFAEDRNKRYRRSMEDAHCFFYNFGNVEGAGFFAIFDGHAGKSTAEYCGTNFHEVFIVLIFAEFSTNTFRISRYTRP